jgi:type II secretory pathway predicted ATPase ExeA
MITTVQKEGIIELIERDRSILGSYSKVAAKCGVAVATITNNILNEERWPLVKDGMWVKVSKGLGFELKQTGWQVAETSNYIMMQSILNMAQSEAMWLAVSEKAGSGKTTGIKAFAADDDTKSVFVIQCQEWARKRFLLELARVLGLSFPANTLNETLSNGVVMALRKRAAEGQPILIIDEADKLKPSAIRWLIHLYNQVEDEVGCVICGTEHLEKEIKKGVRLAWKGYDELDSRLGRRFVHLQGLTDGDVEKVAVANGLTDKEAIKRVWDNSFPKERVVNGKYVTVVECLRTVKVAVRRELRKAAFNELQLN